MLEHYVFLKYQEGTSATHVASFCERMLALQGSIGEIRRLEIGRDELHDALLAGGSTGGDGAS